MIAALAARSGFSKFNSASENFLLAKKKSFLFKSLDHPYKVDRDQFFLKAHIKLLFLLNMKLKKLISEAKRTVL